MITMGPELTATLTALGGGIVGYAVREYRNRVCPLFEVISVDGKVTRRSESTPIPKEVVDSLRGSFYLEELEADSTLGDAWNCWDRCDDLVRFWPETKIEIEEVLATKDDHEFLRALGALLDSALFDKWLQKLLIHSRLDFQITDAIEQQPEIVHAWFEDKVDSPVWFDLPPSGKSFGKGMGHPAIRGKCMPFIIAVSRFHRPGIEHGLKQFISVFQDDHPRALSCIQKLKSIDDDNSRWGLTCFLANTSTSPLIVEKKGRLTIVDRRTKTKFREECYLVLVDEDDMSFTDTSTPLIIPGGTGKVFALLTTHKQKDMELGSAVREVYERKDGHCHLTVTLRRLGIFRRQRYRTDTAPFLPNSGKPK